MSVIAEVKFAHERGALAYTLNHLPETDVKLIRETSTEPEQTTSFLRFDAHEPARIQRVLADDHTVSTVVSMPEPESQKLWRVRFAQDAELLNPLVTSEGGVVLHAQSSTVDGGCRGWHEYWFLPHREAIHTIWQYAREAEFDFEILRFRQWEGALSGRTLTETLTEEQRVALALAYEEGYFTEPRETSLEQLADLLDLSPSAVAGRLKRGTRVLIEEALVDHDREQ